MARQLIEMESLFKALADATRLRILGLLLTGEVCVCDIHESLKIPQPKASRHLAYLRAAGLVDARKEGQWVHYRLSTSADPVRSWTAAPPSDRSRMATTLPFEARFAKPRRASRSRRSSTALVRSDTSRNASRPASGSRDCRHPAVGSSTLRRRSATGLRRGGSCRPG